MPPGPTELARFADEAETQLTLITIDEDSARTIDDHLTNAGEIVNQCCAHWPLAVSDYMPQVVLLGWPEHLSSRKHGALPAHARQATSSTLCCARIESGPRHVFSYLPKLVSSEDSRAGGSFTYELISIRP